MKKMIFIRLTLTLPLLGTLALPEARAVINLRVVDHAGTAVSGFRWHKETPAQKDLPTAPFPICL